ncbi:MAG: winged helix-turn-helix domain-containing protein [Candidatus Sulfotelmatobacter sp.]
MGDEPPLTHDSAVTSPRNGHLHFGTFEVDLRAGELRKGGVKIKLHGQPFEVLAMLLERPGEVVTREELQQRLWVSDTFVDFEHGLNKAINKLREALGDDADNPRYIETLPRRGYRFVGPIALPVHVQVTVGVTEEKRTGEPSPKTRRRKLWAAGLGSAVLCTLIVVGFLWLRSPLPPPRVLSYRQLTTDRQMKGESCGGVWTSKVVTDGARVFFSERDSGVMQVSTNGGEVAKVSNPLACFVIFDISPDKTELLGAPVTSLAGPDQPLWILSIVSGLAHRVGSLNGKVAAWSPDGQRIAYATASHWEDPNELYIAAKDGSDARKLARISAWVSDVRWSSDGKVVRMGVSGSSGFVWEVSSDGTNLHPVHPTNLLPEGNSFIGWINWTPDDRYLVFEAGKPMSPVGIIWALREARSAFHKKTSAPVQLTSGAMNFWSPDLSPDGKQIFAIGGRLQGELIRYDLKLRRLEPYLSGISAEQLDFSRDGKWVTYVTFPEGILWRSRVDGSERMQLTTPPLHAVVPCWSPDGTRIAFAGFLPGAPGPPLKVYVVSAQGGKPATVAEGQNGDIATDPTWTPDGNSLIFGGNIWSTQTKISSVDLRTGRVSIIAGSEGLYGSRISPNGRFIVAAAAGSNKVLLFDQQTQKWSELVNSKILGFGGFGWGKWSSDNRYVYFSSTFTSPPQRHFLYRVDIADRKIERVANVEVPEGTIGIFGPWMGTAPDGSPLLLRDLSIQEIYALYLDLP